MAKSPARNKQAELAKKMAAAKMEPTKPGASSAASEMATGRAATTTTTTFGRSLDVTTAGDAVLTAADAERTVFAQLLNTTWRAIPRPGDDDDDDFGERAYYPAIKAGKPVKQQMQPPRPKPPSTTKVTTVSQADTTSEKRVAERIHFEALVNVTTSQPLGAMAAARLVPWVPPYLTDSLVVLTDPRRHSRDLKVALQYVLQQRDHDDRIGDEKEMNDPVPTTATTTNKKANPSNVRKRVVRVIGITADAPQQARSWMTSGGICSANIQVLSDPDLQWMMAYNVIGGVGQDDLTVRLEDEALHHQHNEWSLTLIEFDTDGSIRRFLRHVDPTHVRSLLEQQHEPKIK